jgi:hypothetical protein
VQGDAFRPPAHDVHSLYEGTPIMSARTHLWLRTVAILMILSAEFLPRAWSHGAARLSARGIDSGAMASGGAH